jgi:hypothetical protein
VRLTTNNSVDASPAWSPDGREIVFESNRLGNTDLFLMNADGGNQRPLVSSARAETDPNWGVRVPGTPAPTPDPPAPQPQPRVPRRVATITSPVSYAWNVKRSRLKLTQLLVRSLPPRARATLRCSGRRCPIKAKTVKARKGGTLNVLKALGRKRTFRAKQIVDLVLAAPGYNAKMLRFKLRAGHVPKSHLYCIPLGRKAVKRRC